MIDRLIDSPRPVPLVLVVKNASNICSEISLPKPGPVSATVTGTESGHVSVKINVGRDFVRTDLVAQNIQDIAHYIVDIDR